MREEPFDQCVGSVTTRYLERNWIFTDFFGDNFDPQIGQFIDGCIIKSFVIYNVKKISYKNDIHNNLKRLGGSTC